MTLRTSRPRDLQTQKSPARGPNVLSGPRAGHDSSHLTEKTSSKQTKTPHYRFANHISGLQIVDGQDFDGRHADSAECFPFNQVALLQPNSHLVRPARMIQPDSHVRTGLRYFRLHYGLLIDGRDNHRPIGRFEIARKSGLLLMLYLPQGAQCDGRRAILFRVAGYGNARRCRKNQFVANPLRHLSAVAI